MFPSASNSAGTGISGGCITSVEPSAPVTVIVPSGLIICELPSALNIASPGRDMSTTVLLKLEPAS